MWRRQLLVKSIFKSIDNLEQDTMRFRINELAFSAHINKIQLQGAQQYICYFHNIHQDNNFFDMKAL